MLRSRYLAAAILTTLPAGALAIARASGAQAKAKHHQPPVTLSIVRVSKTAATAAAVLCPKAHPRLLGGGAGGTTQPLAVSEPAPGKQGWSASATGGTVTAWVICTK